MRVVHDEVAGLPVVRVSGDVDHSSAPLFEDAATEALARVGFPSHLVIDLTDCSYLDGGGLSVVLALLQTLPPDGWLGVVVTSPHVRRLLETIGLEEDHRLHVFSSEAEAAALLRTAEAGRSIRGSASS